MLTAGRVLRKPLNAAAAVFEPTAGAPDGTSASLPTPQDASALAPAPHEPLPVDASSASAAPKTLTPVISAFGESKASTAESAVPKTLAPALSAFGAGKASTAEGVEDEGDVVLSSLQKTIDLIKGGSALPRFAVASALSPSTPAAAAARVLPPGIALGSTTKASSRSAHILFDVSAEGAEKSVAAAAARPVTVGSALFHDLGERDAFAIVGSAESHYMLLDHFAGRGLRDLTIPKAQRVLTSVLSLGFSAWKAAHSPAPIEVPEGRRRAQAPVEVLDSSSSSSSASEAHSRSSSPDSRSSSSSSSSSSGDDGDDGPEFAVGTIQPCFKDAATAQRFRTYMVAKNADLGKKGNTKLFDGKGVLSLGFSRSGVPVCLRCKQNKTVHALIPDEAKSGLTWHHCSRRTTPKDNACVFMSADDVIQFIKSDIAKFNKLDEKRGRTSAASASAAPRGSVKPHPSSSKGGSSEKPHGARSTGASAKKQHHARSKESSPPADVSAKIMSAGKRGARAAASDGSGAEEAAAFRRPREQVKRVKLDAAAAAGSVISLSDSDPEPARGSKKVAKRSKADASAKSTARKPHRTSSKKSAAEVIDDESDDGAPPAALSAALRRRAVNKYELIDDESDDGAASAAAAPPPAAGYRRRAPASGDAHVAAAAGAAAASAPLSGSRRRRAVNEYDNEFIDDESDDGAASAAAAPPPAAGYRRRAPASGNAHAAAASESD